MTRLQTIVLAPAVISGVLLFVPAPARAQLSESEMVMRLDQLENRLRQLTGAIEQLQYRNQQLEQQVRRVQEDTEYRLNERAGRPAAPPATRPSAAAPPPPAQEPAPVQAAPQLPPPGPAGSPRPQRRGDAFDPNENPNAPGTPRTLGSVPPSAPPPGSPPLGGIVADEQGLPPVGAPGGRQAGAPLDLSTLSTDAVNDPALGPPQPAAARPGEIRQIPGVLPPPPPRNTSATGNTQMVMAPSQTPKDEYDLAYGYMLRKDYALAEDALRAFLKKYPSDRMVADANYWLGESLFQRQRYRDAAEIFLNVSTKFEQSGKAPDSLLRLGQSLAALKERESACATFGEIPRKYPKASANVKSAAEREIKRAGC